MLDSDRPIENPLLAGGELTPIDPETTARLLQAWTPRAVRTRYFTCRAKATPHAELLVRAREEPGGLRVAEYHPDAVVHRRHGRLPA